MVGKPCKTVKIKTQYKCKKLGKLLTNLFTMTYGLDGVVFYFCHRIKKIPQQIDWKNMKNLPEMRIFD